MKLSGILIVSAALPVSIAVSFFSRQFWLGFLLPLGGLALYLVAAAFHATGWKLDHVGLPLAFSIALMLTLGPPMSVISGIGAWLGLYLSRRRFSAKIIWSLILISGLIVGALWLRHIDHENDLKNQKSRAIEFLKSHPLIVQNGGKVASHISSTTMTGDGTVLGYEITTSLGFAIVSVVPQSSGREFKLECITTLSLGGRDPFKIPCEQGTVLTETNPKALSANPSINTDAAR